MDLTFSAKIVSINLGSTAGKIALILETTTGGTIRIEMEKADEKTFAVGAVYEFTGVLK